MGRSHTTQVAPRPGPYHVIRHCCFGSRPARILYRMRASSSCLFTTVLPGRGSGALYVLRVRPDLLLQKLHGGCLLTLDASSVPGGIALRRRGHMAAAAS